MKKIAGSIAIVIALICVAYFFTIDIFVKVMIEREGSKALRAKLDIASATFHLLPASLTLRGVQATNPQQPMSNLLQADVVAMPLQLGELLDRKLIIDTMQIHGLRFAQPRAHSGAIEGLTPTPAVVTTPTAAAMQTTSPGDRRSELQRRQSELAGLGNDWRSRLPTLPSAAQLDTYRMRARSANADERAQLRDELHNQLSHVRALQERLALDLERVNPSATAQATGAANAVQLATGEPVSMAGVLLSGEFKPLLNQLLGLIAPAANNTAENPPPEWQLLAHEIAVDGEIQIGASPLAFIGTIENATPQQRYFDKVTRVELQSPATQPGKFSASGSFDYRKLPLQNLRFDLGGFALAELPLSTTPGLRITVVQAITDIQGLLSLTGNQIDINVLARFQQAQLRIDADADPLHRTVADTLRGVRDFDLNFQASGNVNNPLLEMNSSLDLLLAETLKRALDASSTTNSAGGELAPELGEIGRLGAELQQIQRTLLTTQHALQQLLDL